MTHKFKLNFNQHVPGTKNRFRQNGHVSESKPSLQHVPALCPVSMSLLHVRPYHLPLSGPRNIFMFHVLATSSCLMSPAKSSCFISWQHLPVSCYHNIFLFRVLPTSSCFMSTQHLPVSCHRDIFLFRVLPTSSCFMSTQHLHVS